MISIITPVYNGQKYLCDCIDSILSQTLEDFELLLVNGGSTDDTGRICDEYATHDHRVRVFHTENRGASHARNIALAHAAGEWIGFVDADDIAEQELFETLLNKAVHSGADSALCGYLLCDEQMRPIDQTTKPEKELILNCDQALTSVFLDEYYGNYQGYVWNRLFRRDIIERLQLRFDETIVFSEDKLFACRYLLECETIFYITKPLYRHRYCQNSLTTSDSYLKGAKDELYVFKSLKNHFTGHSSAEKALTGWHLHNCIARLFALLRQDPNNITLYNALHTEFTAHKKLWPYRDFLGKKHLLFAAVYRRFPKLCRKMFSR